jgi:hypothetical protein
MDRRKRVFIYSGGGFEDGCKMWWSSGLRRCVLLDGVFLVGWKMEVYLRESFTVGALSKKCLSPSTYRLGMWLVAIWNVPCGYMEGAHP